MSSPLDRQMTGMWMAYRKGSDLLKSQHSAVIIFPAPRKIEFAFFETLPAADAATGEASSSRGKELQHILTTAYCLQLSTERISTRAGRRSPR